MKLLAVAIYGSSTTKNSALAFALGKKLATCNITLISGASTGISEAVVKGFNNPNSIGYSPTKMSEETEQWKTISLNNLGNIIHTGKFFDQLLKEDLIIDSKEARFKFRNYLTAAACNIAICLDGGFGTLTEVILALGMNKNVIVLKNSGGISDKLEQILSIINLKRNYLTVVNSIEEIVIYIDMFEKQRTPSIFPPSSSLPDKCALH